MDIPEALPDALVVLSHVGVVQFANRVFLQFVGFDAASVVGKPLEKLISDQEVMKLVGVMATLDQGPLEDRTVLFDSRSGGARPLVVRSGLRAPGEPVVLVGRAPGSAQRELAEATRWVAAEQERVREISEAHASLEAWNRALTRTQKELSDAYQKLKQETEARERLEDELKLAQKLEAIGQLAAGIAHEINTPLQYIGSNVSFLVRAFDALRKYADELRELVLSGVGAKQGEPKLKELERSLRMGLIMKEVPGAIQQTLDGVQRVSKIVHAMKSFAHGDAEVKAPADVNRAILDTLVISQNEYKHVADIETEFAELPLVYCHIGRLNQVFLNLIVNAAHALEDKNPAGRGVIRVATRPLPGAIEVVVSDTGCGIPAALRAKVFEPFFTTKKVGRGSGQGLSLARTIVVDGHGGQLRFETKEGEGTTFYVVLPLSEPRSSS